MSRFRPFNLVSSVKDRLLNGRRGRRAFQKVIELAGDKEGPAVGLLTAANRDSFTKVRLSFISFSVLLSLDSRDCSGFALSLFQAREHLISLSSTNAATFEAIQSSILFVTLDDSSPASGERALEEKSWKLWVGEGGSNRWFDKHECQFRSSPSSLSFSR